MPAPTFTQRKVERPMQDTASTHRLHPSAATRRPRSLALGVALIAIAVGLIAPTSTFAASTVAATDGVSTTACTGGAWPLSVQGMPALHAGSAAGDYLWHDTTGWHLRVTHASTVGFGFSGTIRANRPLHVTGYRLESGDHFTVSADHLSVTYRFVNHGRLDGLNFTTACATRLAVGGRMNGSLLPVRRIWIGHAGRHPLQNPFVILRRA
jgi:hypothetical protein